MSQENFEVLSSSTVPRPKAYPRKVFDWRIGKEVVGVMWATFGEIARVRARLRDERAFQNFDITDKELDQAILERVAEQLVAELQDGYLFYAWHEFEHET